VYSAVAIAATSTSPVNGALVMFFFWLGTVPALVLAGASAERLHRLKSQILFRRAAGAIMIIIGILAMAPFRMLIH
jgi:sulfite exporter TauE/SafE